MHTSSILLDLTEWVLLVAMFATGILIKPFEGDGRGERHPGRRRRLNFYISILVAALSICKLLEPNYTWQFAWVLPAFAGLSRAIWAFEGKRLLRHMRTRRAQMKIQPQS